MNFNLNYKSSSDQLFGQCWKSAKTDAVLVVIHGLGEHIGRYESFAQFFNKKNITVLGTDLTGFGKSPGKKGHGIDITEMKSIVKANVSYAASQFPNIPIYIFGQSMGANIALNYQLTELDERVDGYIAASPWIQTGSPLSPLLISAAKVLSKIAPKVTKSNDLVVEGISDLDSEVKLYVNDPLVHDRISFGFGYSMYLAAEFLNNYSEGGVKVNTLLSHSKDDILTSAAASSAFAKRNPNKLAFIEKDHLHHELHNSSQRNKILEEYYSWIHKMMQNEN